MSEASSDKTLTLIRAWNLEALLLGYRLFSCLQKQDDIGNYRVVHKQ